MVGLAKLAGMYCLYPFPCLSRTIWQWISATIMTLLVGSMQSYFREILRFIDRMGPTEWVLVLGVVIVIGFFCMKGFGSRSNY
jgi:O-antigen/teichoic acid export membrane protein